MDYSLLEISEIQISKWIPNNYLPLHNVINFCKISIVLGFIIEPLYEKPWKQVIP